MFQYPKGNEYFYLTKVTLFVSQVTKVKWCCLNFKIYSVEDAKTVEKVIPWKNQLKAISYFLFYLWIWTIQIMIQYCYQLSIQHFTISYNRLHKFMVQSDHQVLNKIRPSYSNNFLAPWFDEMFSKIFTE